MEEKNNLNKLKRLVKEAKKYKYHDAGDLHNKINKEYEMIKNYIEFKKSEPTRGAYYTIGVAPTMDEKDFDDFENEEDPEDKIKSHMSYSEDINSIKMAAIMQGNVDILDYLKEKGCEVSYEDKFKALKRAIRIGRGDIYEENTAVGELYSELLKDDDVDVKIMSLPLNQEEKEYIKSKIKYIINHSKDLETAEEKLNEFYKQINRNLINNTLDAKIADMRLLEIAYELEDLYYVSKIYDEKAKKMANNGQFGIANEMYQVVDKFKLWKLNEEMNKRLKIKCDPIAEYIKSGAPSIVREIRYQKRFSNQ